VGEGSVKADAHKANRREFLVLGGFGALSIMGGGVLAKHALSGSPVGAAPGPPLAKRLVATDGHIALPGRPAYPDPDLLVFGFVEAPLADYPLGSSIAAVTRDFKGRVKVPAPIIGVDEGQEFLLVLTNVGLLARPDLDDSHTVHWHGFRNPVALFDGVPELSIAVPVYRDFPYVYKPHDEGTYMYHCHFEDSEHVQMGMTGVVFVRPDKGPHFAYDDTDGSTAFDREFTFMLNEIDQRPHDGLEQIQEFIWSDYKPQYWILNGRVYPDTVELSGANLPAHLTSQPVSSLMQMNPGERGLMRMANLGYEQHAMQLIGIPMTVVGEDATFLRNPSGTDLSYMTDTIYIGPGEARDVIFTAPAYDAGVPGGTDDVGAYNRYFFANASSHKNRNPGSSELGGMVTEVRVYADGPLPAQTEPNQTYG
jgi:FtsP/CotA-like multicopper oxidase with cupredoxin domain